MPVCFQLSRKGDPKKEVLSLQKVDEEICAHMGVPVDKVTYCCFWYGTIGMALALGAPWDNLLEYYKDDPDRYKIVLFMKDNYDSDNWREVGK